MQNFIINFGYPALFLGSFLEGESFLIAAGFLAKRGYLSFDLVVLIALAGAYLGDVALYFLGRNKGEKLISKFPQAKMYYPRARNLFDRYGIWAIFITRYLYGLRFASAAFLGLMRMRRRRFLPFAFLSCMIWATIIGGAGYLFGASVEALLGQIRQYEMLIVPLIIAMGVGAWGLRRFRAKRRCKNLNQKGKEG